MARKNIFVINGSASENSSNQRLIGKIISLTTDDFSISVYNDLKTLPHFDPQLSADNPPEAIKEFRKQVEQSDGVIICTPEYIFSIPSGLKNAIEWCVSAVVFSDKPLGIITASASGEKGHEELMMIMTTVMAKFNDDTTLLIQGIKGKIDAGGEITDAATRERLKKFIEAFRRLITPG